MKTKEEYLNVVKVLKEEIEDLREKTYPLQKKLRDKLDHLEEVEGEMEELFKKDEYWGELRIENVKNSKYYVVTRDWHNFNGDVTHQAYVCTFGYDSKNVDDHYTEEQAKVAAEAVLKILKDE